MALTGSVAPSTSRSPPPINETFNIVRGTFTDASDNSLYQQVDYPQVALASPDGIDRIDPFDLAMVQSPSQAQRLAKQRLQRQQYGGVFETVMNFRGWLVQKNSVVTLSFSRLGWVDKLFRVSEMEHRVDGTCPIILREENEDIYAWDEDESPAVEAADPTTYDFTLDPIVQGIDEAVTPTGARRLLSMDPLYPITSDDDSITIVSFSGVTEAGDVIAFPSDTSLTSLASGTKFGLFWDGSAYSVSAYPAETEMADSSLVFIGWVSTSTVGTFPTPDTPPEGWGGSGPGWIPREVAP